MSCIRRPRLHPRSIPFFRPWVVLLLSVLVLTRADGAPILSSLEPRSGPPGATVTIQGTDLSQVYAVTFGGVPADFSVLSATRLIAIVPKHVLSGPVIVESRTGNASSPTHFLAPPRVLRVRPARAAPGTTILIEGANFGNATHVYLGTTPIDFQRTSSSQIFAVLPNATTNAQLAVVSSVGFGLSPSPYAITGPAPIVDAFEPALGPPGSGFHVFGANLENVSQVFLGSVAASFLRTAIDQLEVTVPATALTGPLVLRGSLGSVTSSVPYVVTRAPVIRQFAPTLGRPGTAVLIEGINFEDLLGASVNGKSVSGIASAAPGQIQITIPEGATSGPLRVTNRFGTGTSTNSFTLATGPLILDFDPPFGAAGSPVRIEGINFSGLTGPAAVRFGSRPAASYAVTADTQIQAVVPEGFAEGLIVVSNRSGASTSSVPFLVTGRAPFVTSIEPASGPPGTVVKITGINLDAATAVQFNGQIAAGVEITAPTQLFAMAPAGVTTGPLIVSSPRGSSSNRWVFSGLPRMGPLVKRIAIAGEEVLVRGTNFSGATSLRLGELELVFTLSSTNELRFVLPATALRGSLTLETDAGIHTLPESLGVAPTVAGFDPLFGPAGSLVTLTGSGFGEVSAVLLGEVAADFSARAPDRLEMRVPAGATNGVLTVRTPDGTARSTNVFIVTGTSDLRTRVEFPGAPVAPGNMFEWWITVTNAGPLAASRVGLTNTFPTSVQIDSVASAWPVVKLANRVEVALGVMTNGQSATVRLRGTAPRSGYFTNTARAFGFELDPFPINNVSHARAVVLSETDRTLMLHRGVGTASRVVVTWPQSGLPLQLETTADLVSPILWLPVTTGIIPSEGRFVFTNTTAGRERYFRLTLPPDSANIP